MIMIFQWGSTLRAACMSKRVFCQHIHVVSPSSSRSTLKPSSPAAIALRASCFMSRSFQAGSLEGVRALGRLRKRHRAACFPHRRVQVVQRRVVSFSWRVVERQRKGRIVVRGGLAVYRNEAQRKECRKAGPLWRQSTLQRRMSLWLWGAVVGTRNTWNRPNCQGLLSCEKSAVRVLHRGTNALKR